MRDITIDDLRQIKNMKLIELSSPNAVAYHNALVDKVSNTIHTPKFRRKIMRGYKKYLILSMQLKVDINLNYLYVLTNRTKEPYKYLSDL